MIKSLSNLLVHINSCLQLQEKGSSLLVTVFKLQNLSRQQLRDLKFKDLFALLYHACSTSPDNHLYSVALRTFKRYLGAGNGEITVFLCVPNEVKLLSFDRFYSPKQNVPLGKWAQTSCHQDPSLLKDTPAAVLPRSSVSHRRSSSSNLVTTQTTESFRRLR